MLENTKRKNKIYEEVQSKKNEKRTLERVYI